jgi:ABC-type polysaccharide/polyol phosphate transport system ATPase subunit
MQPNPTYTHLRAAPPDSPFVVEAEHVSKLYFRTEHRLSLRHEGLSVLRHLFGQHYVEKAQPFYALHDVNFAIRRGESVGVIGRNGSGKTTLLRLLSGITAPTSGSIQVSGRFATLIGLGTGFNQQLTGRENIYLNAAIQGVPPKAIDPIVDEIIDFADLRPFIDTRVSRYSSGMFARLAFSIMIHIVPEVIFADEALSVGDTAFQEKCMERLLQFREQHKTLLFVSHSMSLLETLCERTLWLNGGHLIMDGDTQTVLEHYRAATTQTSLPDISL